ncbi:MAG TPA: response regulator [Chlorobaculum sp.]|nr:response regulator [Chlorobaculum sp.]
MTEENHVDRSDKTILVVDDEHSVVTMIKIMLENNGYTVIPAYTPAQALQLTELYKESIDLMLTDLIMPEIDGYELSELARTIIPDLKVLFISGYSADMFAKHNALKEGVIVLKKPFSVRSLCSSISALLDT